MARSVHDDSNKVQAFQRWIAMAEPGSALCYAQAAYGDRRRQSEAVAKAAWRAYEQGLVELVQRKKEEGTIEYLAVKRSEVKPPMQAALNRRKSR